jgi:hypothetical protein
VHAHAATACVDEWDATLSRHLGTCGLQQFFGKRQLYIKFKGPLADQNACTVLRAAHNGWGGGALTHRLFYLGAWVGSSPSPLQNIRDRIAKAKRAWHSLGRFWTTVRIGCCVRVTMFKALVLGTLLSGLESEVLVYSHYVSLERVQCKYARVLMTGDAMYHSNAWVRTRLKVPTSQSLLCARRVRMLQSWFRCPSHHINVLGALTGNAITSMTSHFGSCAQLDDMGFPCHTCNPSLQQFWDDIAQVAHIVPAVRSVLEAGWVPLARNQEFQRFKVQKLYSFEGPVNTYTHRSDRTPSHCPSPFPDGRVAPPHPTPLMLHCPMHACDSILKHVRGLRIHLTKSHAVQKLF